MSILAQHGFGKGQKLQAGLKQKTIGGVVFSPRDEEPSELVSLAKGIRSEFAEAVLLMDPQVYRSEERRVGKECRSRWSPYH